MIYYVWAWSYKLTWFQTTQTESYESALSARNWQLLQIIQGTELYSIKWMRYDHTMWPNYTKIYSQQCNSATGGKNANLCNDHINFNHDETGTYMAFRQADSVSE
jgi:hypothetical protein